MNTKSLTAVDKKVRMPPKHPKKRIDVAEALKLRLKGYAYIDIARRYGVTKQAVEKALREFRNLLGNPDSIQAYNAYEADILDAAKFQVISRLVDSRVLEKASVNNLAYAFAQLNNASRLLRGQSTENIAVAITSEERAELEAIARMYAERKREKLREQG